MSIQLIIRSEKSCRSLLQLLLLTQLAVMIKSFDLLLLCLLPLHLRNKEAHREQANQRFQQKCENIVLLLAVSNL